MPGRNNNNSNEPTSRKFRALPDGRSVFFCSIPSDHHYAQWDPGLYLYLYLYLFPPPSFFFRLNGFHKLLERILLPLALLYLLLLQRTNSTFKLLIQTSPSLQRQTYHAQHVILSDFNFYGARLNPLLEDHLRRRFSILLTRELPSSTDSPRNGHGSLNVFFTNKDVYSGVLKSQWILFIITTEKQLRLATYLKKTEPKHSSRLGMFILSHSVPLKVVVQATRETQLS